MASSLILLLLSCDGFLFDTEKYDPGMWVDEDGDGYPQSMDCEDLDTASFPDAAELCDGVDNDCDGTIDEGVGGIWFFDSDFDGFGDPNTTTESCENPGNYVDKGGDCDDADAESYPGALEYCDGADNDCNDLVDDDAVDGDWYFDDIDGDGFGDPDNLYWSCEGVDNDWDCNDLNTSEPHIVNTTGSGVTDGSMANPWTRIQDGINYAQECVVVLPGTYNEAINFQGRGVAVIGAGGPENTIIDATGFAQAVVSFSNLEGPDAELRGFTLTGGAGHLDTESTSENCYSNIQCVTTLNSWCGGGVYAFGASPTLRELVITANSLPPASTVASGYDSTTTDSFGGGVCLVGSQTTLDEVDLIGNYAAQAGGLYVGDGATVTHKRSLVMGNTATSGGAYQVYAGELSLQNVAAAFNTATTEGGGLHVYSGSAALTNVTLDRNSGASGGSALVSTGGAISLLNSLITYTPTGYGLVGETGATVTVQYTGVYSNLPDHYAGLASDPNADSSNLSTYYIDYISVTDDGLYDNDDHHLIEASPAVDAGHPAAGYNDTDGTRNDLGAYGGPEGAW